MNNQLSIIIPILNEAETIKHLLNYLLKNSSKKNVSEIIVVDATLSALLIKISNNPFMGKTPYEKLK